MADGTFTDTIKISFIPVLISTKLLINHQCALWFGDIGDRRQKMFIGTFSTVLIVTFLGTPKYY